MKYNFYDEKEIAKIVLVGGVVVIVGGVTIFSLGGEIIGRLSSNRDKIDTEKSFNIAFEQTKNTISIVTIRNYTDFKGDTIEFETFDGLRVLTSLVNTSLLKEDDFKDAYEYAKLLARGQEEKIMVYDDLQNNPIELKEGWNKRIANFDYNFDKAVELKPNGTIIIYDIQAWKDWEDDDKLQITTKDGRVWLTHYENVRLIDTSKAREGAFENYILSLIGNKEDIIYYSEPSKRLIKSL